MKRICTVLAICLMGASAFADFTGPYAPGLWTLLNEAFGSGSLTTTTMTVVGGDVGMPGRVEYYIKAPSSTTLKFDWSYTCPNTSGYDYSYYAINDVQTTLGTIGYGGTQTGSVSTAVTAGQKFSIGVYTLDGVFGAGVMTVTKFVPEPASLSLLALGGLALLRRR